jgi:hypothetical protein
MVYSVETAGFSRGFSRGAQRSAVESATAKRMGLDAKQAEKNTYLPHFAKICHSATLSVTSQPIVFQPLKPQVTDLQIFSKTFLWYFSAI